MRFDCPKCTNEKCHHHNIGYYNNCYMTSWAGDPEKCKVYKPEQKSEKSRRD